MSSSADLPPHAVIRPLCLEDVDKIMRLEESGFPPEERCSREKALYRLRVCPELCAGVFIREFDTSRDGNNKASNDNTSNDDDDDNNNNTSNESQINYNHRDNDSEDNFNDPDRLSLLPRSSLKSERLIGQIIATKLTTPLITDASMEIPELDESGQPKNLSDPRGHHEEGRTIGIHSLVVDPEFRGKQIGSILLRDYIQRITTQHVADRISIIAHDRLIPFYVRFNFVDEGLSKVELAGGGWHDLWVPLSQNDDEDEEDDDETM